MKVRVVSTPDGHWVVEKKVFLFWNFVEKFYQWTPDGDSAERAALKYAQLLINPKIIEVKQ